MAKKATNKIILPFGIAGAVIIAAILKVIVASLFASFQSIGLISNPKIGDFYIAKTKIFDKAESTNGKKVKYKGGGYRIFQIKEVGKTEVVFKYSGSQISPYSYAKKLLLKGEAYVPGYYDDGREISLKKEILNRLNFLGTIVSAHRLNHCQSSINMKIAMNLCEDRNYLEAIEYFNKIDHSTLTYYKFNRFAECIYDGRKYQESLGLYLKAVDLYPKKAQPAHMAGLCYSMLKNYSSAVTLYERAIAINPAHTSTYGNLGSLYSILKNSKRALACYRVALEKVRPNKSLFLNYLESLLIEGEQYDKKLEIIALKKGFLSDKAFAMAMEMLKILFLNEEGFDVSEHISKWEANYNGIVMKWNFEQLDDWARTVSRKMIIKDFKKVAAES